MPYDSFNQVTSFANFDLSQILAGSYIMYLDWCFLNIGTFANVKLNNSNIKSANQSVLRLANDQNYTNGQVWETTHNNLVWESGVSVSTQPIAISGIYVNNTFYPKNTSGTFKHHVEYTNGRVIFDTAIATNSVVKMEHSYKTISILEAKDFPALREMQFRTFDPYDNRFQITNSGIYNKDPQQRVQLPLIAVEITPRMTTKPHELGNFVKRVDANIIYHVMAETDAMVKKITSILALQKESTQILLDMDKMARSGVFPLDENGKLSTNPTIYPNLIKENAYPLCTSFIKVADATNENWVGTNLYYGTVNNVMEIIY